jgi:hypothetical protein
MIISLTFYFWLVFDFFFSVPGLVCIDMGVHTGTFL